MCAFSLVSRPGREPGQPRVTDVYLFRRLPVRRGEERRTWLSIPAECSSSAPTRVRARGLPALRAVSHSSARWLQPPPSGSLQSRRHSPAPGRSLPPPRPQCWPGSASEPRETCKLEPELCRSPSQTLKLDPALFALWPVWDWLS